MATTIRTRRKPAAAPLPVDVRVTHMAANTLFTLLAVVLAGGAVLWLVRSPGFALRGLALESQPLHVHMPTLRAQVTPHLRGNFFTVDLDRVQTAFEAVPWVRHAVVRRVWPDRLTVRLEEHRPAAVWDGLDTANGSERLVNDHGEVFEASAGDLDEASVDGAPMPTFSGPEGSAASMLSLYRRLRPLMAELGQPIESLQLSDRGTWRAELEGDTVIEMGRGSEEQLLARTRQFVQTVGEATERWRAPLAVADLRHTDGYAVRLRGISVAPAGAASAAAGARTTRTN